jgi:hypothetical protein
MLQPDFNPDSFSEEKNESYESIVMESLFDDTLPLPADVERAFLEHAGDGLSATEWLEERGIDPAPIENAALIQSSLVWNSHAGRYDFLIYGPDHIGPKRRPALAVPIVENGQFIDLLLIGDFVSFDDDDSDDRYFETVCCRTPWLGRQNICAVGTPSPAPAGLA